MNKYERLKNELVCIENGWTKTIFGKVVRAEYQGVVIYGV